MIILTDYQKTAVEDSLSEVQRILSSTKRAEEPRRFLLQAPTGSGKTVMASSVIRELASLENKDFAFIFMAPNTLHTQSKASFEQHLNGENVTLIDMLPIAELDKNSVLFLNWSSVNKKSNKIIMDSEEGRNIANMAAATHALNREIIVIIDESHHSASSVISKEFVASVSPRMIFEITATPKDDAQFARDSLDGLTARVEVDKKDVIEEGMICKSAVFGQDYEIHEKSFLEKFGTGNTDPNELYVWAALEERKKFESALIGEGNDFLPAYNPAVGIQLPSEGKADKDAKEELSKVDELIAFLEKCGVQRDEIAVYLSGRRENMDEKNTPLDEVKVVIFKTAIAVGWDFPRLKVGALLRDTKTKSFAVQTLGRWMRQPERKQYGNEYLNSAYFYTDVELMPAVANGDIDVSLAKTVTIRDKFKKSASEIKLVSTNRLTFENVILDTGYFAKNWVKALRDEWTIARVTNGHNPLSEGITLSPKAIFAEMGFTIDNAVLGAVKEVGSYVITDIDAVEAADNSADHFRQDLGSFARRLSNFETEAEFEKAIQSVLKHHHVSNADNIINHILTSISRVTKLSGSTVARIIKAEKCLPILINVVETVVAKFKLEHAASLKDNALFEEVKWTPAETSQLFYTKNAKTGTSKSEPREVSDESRYLYDFAPALGAGVGNSSNIEKEYFEYLDSEAANGEIEWFVKNGDQGREFFSILYNNPVVGTDRTKKSLFYPDWIIKRADGSIELHDTKKGGTMEHSSTLPKLKAAVAFCNELTEKFNVEVSAAMVMSEKKYGTTFFYKSKRDVSNLAEDDRTNWESIF